MWKIFYAPETCSLATRIVLEEIGQDYELINLSIDAGDHLKPDYLSLNPKGRVPTLVTPFGTLTETPAILAFLAQMFPKAGLVPLDDAYGFAKIQELNSYIASTLHVYHAHRMRGHRWADDSDSIKAMQRKVPENVSKAFKHIEQWYLEGPYVLGDKYSVADAYLYTFARWLELDGVDPLSVKKVIRHRSMIEQRPAVLRALDIRATF